ADDGAPVGHAAPPTEAATHGAGPVRAGLEIFAQYSYRSFSGPGDNQAWFHAFDVPRAHAALEGELEAARGRVVLEATRSASEGSLLGVAGDSLVLRLREAYGAYRVVAPLELSAGVVPTLTVPNLDGTWMLRPVAPSALEANALMSPADLGAKARVDLPRGYGWLAAAAYNGDGYTNRELNRGKTFEGAAEVHPLPSGALRPLGVFGSYVAGSTGTSLARADRLTGGLVWQGARVRGGAYFTYAWGVAQLGTQRAMLASAFVRVEPVPRLLLGARADHVVRDAAVSPNDALTTVWGSVGYRVALPVESFLALTRSLPTARAESEVPGSNAWELRAIARVVF
ncbi:MAG: hypothetical protein KF782_34650, partial [Labilithrix sp.]|nr:hypothetical protein [Labilithrix sp.]